MKFKLRRRDIILIAGFWLVGCALLAAVAYYAIQLQQPPTPPPEGVIVPQATFTVVHTQVTAKSMQTLTPDTLALWADDAQFYTVAATWDGADLAEVGQPTIWTYRYYSPGQKRLFFITVSPQGNITPTSHGERVYHPPQPIPMEDWVVDSPEAVNIWLNYGGAAMLAALPGIQVVAQLHVPEPGKPLTWTVAGYDPLTNHYHTVFIEAKTGNVLNIVSSLR